jgi:hypothetical protein
MAGRQRDRAKERHWRRHLAAWQRSGQSVRAYCTAKGLAQPAFYAWRRVLAQRGATPSSPDNHATRTGTAAAGRDATPAFVPVSLVADAAVAPAIEIVLREQRVVRVATGFEVETLRQVVVALEGLPC